MAKTVLAEVRIADLPQMQQFIAAAGALSAALLANWDDLPEQVRAAAGELREALPEVRDHSRTITR